MTFVNTNSKLKGKKKKKEEEKAAPESQELNFWKLSSSWSKNNPGNTIIGVILLKDKCHMFAVKIRWGNAFKMYQKECEETGF